MWKLVDECNHFFPYICILCISVPKTCYIGLWLHPLLYIYTMHTPTLCNIYSFFYISPHSSQWNCYTSLLIWPASLHLLVCQFYTFHPNQLFWLGLSKFCHMLKKKKKVLTMSHKTASVSFASNALLLNHYKLHSTQKQMPYPP